MWKGSDSLSGFCVLAALVATPGMAAVLPASRSVAPNSPASAFATIINGGTTAAANCSIALPAGFPGTFTYQTTNEINARIGSPDVPVGIPAGGKQGFVFAITPTVDLDAVEVALIYACDNVAPAVSVPGLNRLTLSSSTTPTPDLISISATPSNDGIVTVTPNGGFAFFAGAAINIGAAGAITASVDDDGAGLPLTATICRTNPSNGQCVTPASPAAATTSTIATNETATYTIYVSATGAIPFDPARNRLVLRLVSADGVTRGSTSVAVRTP